MNEPLPSIIGGASGIITGILVALGFKSRIDRIEDKVVFSDTCGKCLKGITQEVKNIKEAQTLAEQKREDAKDVINKSLQDIAVFMGKVEAHLAKED